MEASEPAPPPPSPRRRLAPLVPLAWLLGGVGLTLLVLVTLRSTLPTPPAPAAASSPVRSPAVRREASSGPAPPREQFATLYLSYLLNTYYVPSRGFCQPLLRKICTALHTADLLLDARDCDSVPNDELVLAIGRYQHRVGLPVDGKAGPETVRMMLGGDFSNRRGMEAAYCTGPSALDAGAAASD